MEPLESRLMLAAAPLAPVLGEDGLFGEYTALEGDSIDTSFQRLPGVLVNDFNSPAAGNPVITPTLLTQPVSGGVRLFSTGHFVYFPSSPNFNGHDSFTYNATISTTLIPLGGVATTTANPAATWKFLDDGSDQGQGWTDPSFDDSAWKSGITQIGYGESDQRTVASFGPNPAQKPITTYFRKSFELADAAKATRLTLQLQHSDGAAVYINGTRVVLRNLVADAPFNQPSIANQTQTTVSFEVSPGLLRDGVNTIAAEVHQNSVSGVDMSFDLSLVAQFTSVGTVHLNITPVDDRPEVVPDNYIIPLGGSVSGNVLDNERGPGLVAELVGPPPAQAVQFSFNPDGSFTYKPRRNFSGDDFFQYKVTDAHGVSLPGTVTIRTGVIENENNNSIATAMDLDRERWTKTFDHNIQQSTEIDHVSVQGVGDGTLDYYRFTAAGGNLVVWDIDATSGLDATIRIIDLAGNVLATNDAADTFLGEGGSQTILDPFVSGSFSTGGTFVLEVGGFPAGTGVTPGARYQFNLSITNHIQLLKPITGNINGDGLLNQHDIDAFFALTGPLSSTIPLEPYEPSLDLNGDGKVDPQDVAELIQGEGFLNSVPGDADLNGEVSIGDLIQLAQNYHQLGGWYDGDFDGDGMVDMGDLTILAERYGQRRANGEIGEAGIPPAPLIGALESNDGEDEEETLEFFDLLAGLPPII